MQDIYMLKYGEIVLKGQNRSKFESKLISSVNRQLAKFGGGDVFTSQSTLYVENIDPDYEKEEIIKALQCVFGIVAIACAKRVSYNFDSMKKDVIAVMKDKLSAAKTFKVRAKRADKSYPLTSPEIERDLGEFILDNFSNLTVDVHHSELTIYIEVREGNIYVHDDPVKGAGGLPEGTSGHGLLMLSGGLDSPVAGYCLAKRGMKLSCIHFESPPYTSERALQKVKKLGKILTQYVGNIDLYTVHFTEVQEKIHDICKEDYFTIIMRRIMLRISCEIAHKINAKAIITGESLGQVASQTLDAIICTDNASDIPVFRPFIGTDKQDIINIAHQIGTYDISIEPYEDCCTVFTPRHPKTSPSLESVIKEEQKLDIESLLSNISIEKEQL